MIGRRTISLLAISLCLPTAAASPGPARAQAFDNVTVFVGGYEVFGRVDEVDEHDPALATATLTRAGTVLATAAAPVTSDGGMELQFVSAGVARRRAIVILPGDTVTLSAVGGGADVGRLVLSVPRLTAQADSDTDRVTGTAPPGTALTVTASGADGGFKSVRTTSGGDGTWSAVFEGQLDITPGAHGEALFFGAGAVYQSSWAVRDVAVAIGDPTVVVRARRGQSVHAIVHGDAGRQRADGRSVAWAGTANVWLHDAAGEARPLLPGDRLALSLDGVSVAARVVPPVTAEVDADADAVSGVTEPGRAVRVTADGEIVETRADTGGSYRAEFAALADLGVDSVAEVALTGSPWRLSAYVPAVRRVDPWTASVWGQGTAGTAVELAVLGDNGAELHRVSGRVGTDGSFALAAFDASGSPVPTRDGQTMRVTIDGRPHPVAWTAPEFGADGRRDRVFGAAAPGSRVTVRVTGATRQAVAAADGQWQVDLADAVDLMPGDVVAVTVEDPSGYETGLAFPVFRANVRVGSDRALIDGHPGLEATVELERDGAAVGSGTCTVALTSCQALLRDGAGRPAIVQPEDTVLVFPGVGGTASLEIYPLTAHIDLGGRDVVGECPPGSQVRIAFAQDGGGATPLDTSVGSDENGVYDYELDASQWDLLAPGLVADVYHQLANGHRLTARAVVEVMRVSPGSATIGGLAEPLSPVSALLWPPTDGEGPAGAPLAAGEATAGGDGAFSLDLRDTSGQLVPVQPGLTVALTHRRRTHVMAVERMAAWWMGPDAALAGATGGSFDVRADYRLLAPPGAPQWVSVSGQADANGVFVLPGPAVSRSRFGSAEVVARRPDGGELRRTMSVVAQPGSAHLPLTTIP